MDRLWKERYTAATLIATAALFYIKDVHSFLFTDKLAGRDLVSNYAFTELMKSNILSGNLFGWSEQWLLGFPSFELYPPGFFFITSIIDIATGGLIELKTAFKLIAFLSTFLVPLTFYLSFRDTMGDRESFVGGLFTLMFVFVHEPISQAYLVLSTGLVAQGLSFLIAVAAVGLGMKKEIKLKTVSGALLGASFLTHPFAALTGFITIGWLTATTRKPLNAVPGVIGGVIGVLWLLNAFTLMFYTPSYTMPTAEPGIYVLLLLPLVVAGGLQNKKTAALLGSSLTLLTMSIFELPLVTQELRFYTYSLGIGTFLAGLGAYRLSGYLSEELEFDRRLFLLLLALPVFSLSIQSDVSALWSFEGDAEPLYDRLEELPQGRVLVETENSSISDAFVLQSKIPLETHHYAVNDVHYDSSTSANYILTLESWISAEPLINPICRSCDTEASDSILKKRLDSLGIRYVVVKTSESREKMRDVMEPEGKFGDYWLFSNAEGYEREETLEYRPVELSGSYKSWREFNDLLFTSNVSRKVVWTEDNGTVSMDGKNASEILKAVQEAPRQRANRPTTWKKRSYFPYRGSSAANFNTVIDY